MLTERIAERVYLKSTLLNNMNNISHGFTTRCGGVSRGKIEGLNLGFRCGDDFNSVTRNYMLAAEDLSMPFGRITASKQTHSTNIRIVTEEDSGKGVSKISDIEETDGLITSCKNLPLVIFYADCVPILLADETAGVIGAVHSGWRGTVGKIAEKAVGMMIESFGSKRENIRAAIGPSIGPCCFETGAEVAEQFDLALVREKGNGKFLVDLWEANKRILINCGVCEENIDIAEMCTVCRQDILYSYRCHKEKTGRMGAFIMQREQA